MPPDQESDPIFVYEHDLYVVKRMRDPMHGEVVVMKLHLPRDGVKEFVIPNRSVTDKTEFRKELSSHGVVCGTKAFNSLMEYVFASIRELQFKRKAELMRLQFGWTDADSKFIIGDREITRDGTFHSPPSSTTQNIAQHMQPTGDMDKWKEVFNLYGKSGLEPHAFAALSAFGSPLLKFLGQNGAIINVIHSDSGTGKTTILKTISGIIDPQKGTVWFDGEDIQCRDPDWVVRRGISHVPEGREVFPMLSVRDNLMMGAFTRRDSAGVAADIERMYGYFPILRERAAQEAGQLSGGQQQMLAIARALMSRPRLLLLDEPSLGLSPKLTKEIFSIVKRVNREEGTTMLLVEQNASIALATADFGYVLEVGRVVMEDRCEALLRKDDIREFYLGMKAESARGERRWKKKKQWR
jgi:branched-chain amino acid transport system ATP-binding protein